MNQLLRDEIMHFSASVVVGLYFANTFNESLIPIFGALCGGFFIDADHLLDHYLAYGFKKFKLRDFLHGMAFKKSQKIYVIFHGWEYPLILSLLTYLFVVNSTLASFILSFAVSQLFHLIIDTATNHVKPQGYSFLYRLKHTFKANKICTKPRR